MPEIGYLPVIEECFNRKVTRGKDIDYLEIFFNDVKARTFDIDKKDTPPQVHSVLKAFMKNYYHSINNIKITPEPESNSVEVVLQVSESEQFELLKSLRAIYDGVKYEAEKADAVLENAKKSL